MNQKAAKRQRKEVRRHVDGFLHERVYHLPWRERWAVAWRILRGRKHRGGRHAIRRV